MHRHTNDTAADAMEWAPGRRAADLGERQREWGRGWGRLGSDAFLACRCEGGERVDLFDVDGERDSSVGRNWEQAFLLEDLGVGRVVAERVVRAEVGVPYRQALGLGGGKERALEGKRHNFRGREDARIAPARAMRVDGGHLLDDDGKVTAVWRDPGDDGAAGAQQVHAVLMLRVPPPRLAELRRVGQGPGWRRDLVVPGPRLIGDSHAIAGPREVVVEGGDQVPLEGGGLQVKAHANHRSKHTPATGYGENKAHANHRLW